MSKVIRAWLTFKYLLESSNVYIYIYVYALYLYSEYFFERVCVFRTFLFFENSSQKFSNFFAHFRRHKMETFLSWCSHTLETFLYRRTFPQNMRGAYIYTDAYTTLSMHFTMDFCSPIKHQWLKTTSGHIVVPLWIKKIKKWRCVYKYSSIIRKISVML